jgi:hypothetical protein
VVVRQSCKLKVAGSIPAGGIRLVFRFSTICVHQFLLIDSLYFAQFLLQQYKGEPKVGFFVLECKFSTLNLFEIVILGRNPESFCPLKVIGILLTVGIELNDLTKIRQESLPDTEIGLTAFY